MVLTAPWPVQQGELVVIVRAGAPVKDDYNDDVPGPDDRINVYGCVVAPRQDGDISDPQRPAGVIIGTTVYFPPGSDVRSGDRLEVRGKEHTIEGEPGRWVSPFNGQEYGVEVATRRVEG